MNKTDLLLALVVLLVYFTLVFCEENNNSLIQMENSVESDVYRSESNELIEEARRRRKPGFYGLHHYWGWHALAIAYFIKVKLVIVAFFLGSAFFWGLRHFWPHRCNAEVVRESPVIYDHPPPSHAVYDHIPYSFDHAESYPTGHSYEATATFDSVSSNDPYSAYADASAADVHRSKRQTVLGQEQHPMSMEEQIAEIMFQFLGLNSLACRRRFICEMEFRSRLTPLTSMAFRIVGRGFFEKYTNARNTDGQATSFFECATVNPQCTVIEENFMEQEMQDHNKSSNDTKNVETTAYMGNEEKENAVNADDDAAKLEKLNAALLLAERHGGNAAKLKNRRRDRKGAKKHLTHKL